VVNNNAAKNRFEACVEGHTAFLNYERRGNDLVLIHTEVPPELEGRGLGGHLARAALDHARAEHLHVVPRCSFVAVWVKRHPEYSDVVR
jgi:predicted GNAT family acetyltransferase